MLLLLLLYSAASDQCTPVSRAAQQERSHFEYLMAVRGEGSLGVVEKIEGTQQHNNTRWACVCVYAAPLYDSVLYIHCQGSHTLTLKKQKALFCFWVKSRSRVIIYSLGHCIKRNQHS